MDELKGKKITNILIDSEDQSYLAFITDPDEGEIVYRAWGDCCSETYFSDIIQVENLLNEVVIDVSDIDLDDDKEIPEHESRQEYDSIYGVRLRTKKGTTVIVFRNSSNGYYGGEILFDGTNRPADIKWIEITKDYSSDD